MVEGVCEGRGLDFELLPGIGQHRPTRKELQKKEGSSNRIPCACFVQGMNRVCWYPMHWRSRSMQGTHIGAWQGLWRKTGAGVRPDSSLENSASVEHTTPGHTKILYWSRVPSLRKNRLGWPQEPLEIVLGAAYVFDSVMSFVWPIRIYQWKEVILSFRACCWGTGFKLSTQKATYLLLWSPLLELGSDMRTCVGLMIAIWVWCACARETTVVARVVRCINWNEFQEVYFAPLMA